MTMQTNDELCLNCKKDVSSILGQFCSTKCSEEWQDKNQKCYKCDKEINLLDGQYTITTTGVLCFECGHEDFSC